MPYFTKKQLVLASKLGKKWGFNRQLSSAVNQLPDGEYPVTQHFEHFHKQGVLCERHIRCEIDILGAVAFCDVTEEFFKQLPTNLKGQESNVRLPTEIQFHESLLDPTEAIRQFAQVGFFLSLTAMQRAWGMLKNGDLLFLVLPRTKAIEGGYEFNTHASYGAMACHVQSDQGQEWMKDRKWHRIGKDHKTLDLPAEFSKAHLAIA